MFSVIYHIRKCLQGINRSLLFLEVINHVYCCSFSLKRAELFFRCLCIDVCVHAKKIVICRIRDLSYLKFFIIELQ